MPCAQEIASQLLIAPLLTSPHRGFKGGAYDPTFQEACNVSFTGWSFILRITHWISSTTGNQKGQPLEESGLSYSTDSWEGEGVRNWRLNFPMCRVRLICHRL
jgi:hypothetical protein